MRRVAAALLIVVGLTAAHANAVETAITTANPAGTYIRFGAILPI